MPACPSCGHDNPRGNNFCGRCGALTPAPPPQELADERKIVTCLFCDLVGFTAASESADPEDVDRMLTAYAEMARARIEAHGGVMEKFIGDAVVGVFGAPVAHEDDPERAVRAGLKIAEDATGLQMVGGAALRLRIGINTGEVLVHLGAATGAGERLLSGDAVNTASRLQSVAPEMGVAVGLATFETTSTVFDYEELAPTTLKGKAQPVRVFHAKAARARFGTDITRTHSTPFVGRNVDRTLLRGAFNTTVVTKSVQLVTIVGEPGMGKSRLVAELFRHIDRLPQLITWRQGRCLPYGEGITFWALGEIVKAHSGILESDPPDVAQDKLDTVLPRGPEREWFRQRLLPLIGIEATSTAARPELFAAWRRFLEHIAEAGPTVVVVEDLHWADPAMLEFIEHLMASAAQVPLLVVATARPELYETSPDYATTLRNASTISLVPLSADAITELVAALLESPTVPPGLVQPLVERAGGNPLHAEEFIRLLKDRDLLVRSDAGIALKSGVEVPLPDSVHALIAARLDTLDPDAKAMLADAAVIGKVFWAGAVAAMGERDVETVTATLRELARKELAHPARQSSMAGEAEYSFSHIITRDVAYSQLPRARRAARHIAAAEWIESKVAGRLEDVADVLAHHYSTAMQLAAATGQTELATELQSPARFFLSLAGERALGLDTTAALANLQRALELTPVGHRARATALAAFGTAALHAARYVEARDALDEAISLHLAAGEVRAAATAMDPLSQVLTNLADPRGWEVCRHALDLLESVDPGQELVDTLGLLAGTELMQGHVELALDHAERALALAAALDMPRPPRALGHRAAARAAMGDPEGLDDYRQAIDLAIAAGEGKRAAALHNNFGVLRWAAEGPHASVETLRAGSAIAEARGLDYVVAILIANTLDPLIDLGEHDEALRLAADLGRRFEASSSWLDLIQARAARARILNLRGLADEVAGGLEWIETTQRESDAAEYILLASASTAPAHVALGEIVLATALLTEFAAAGARRSVYFATNLPAMTRAALQIGDRQLAERLLSGVDRPTRYHQNAVVAARAALSEAAGDVDDALAAYADAADRWQSFGVVTEQAFALLGHGRCLTVRERSSEAAPVLGRAREIFERLQAAPALAEIDLVLRP